MKAVRAPTIAIHCRTASATNSGPLSERIQAGMPRRRKRSVSTSMTSVEETRDNAYLATLHIALDRIAAWSPDLPLVALGLDGYKKDPLRGICLTMPGFNRTARAIGN